MQCKAKALQFQGFQASKYVSIVPIATLQEGIYFSGLVT